MRKTGLYMAALCAAVSIFAAGCGGNAGTEKTAEATAAVKETQQSQADSGENKAAGEKQKPELTGKLVVMTNASGGTFH